MIKYDTKYKFNRHMYSDGIGIVEIVVYEMKICINYIEQQRIYSFSNDKQLVERGDIRYLSKVQ